VTATPEARSSRASTTARSSSGRLVARVEIFSEKIRVMPAALRESSWVSKDWRTVEARAYPIRACPVGSALAATGRGSSTPGRARLTDRGGRDVERLGQVGHEPEAGGVVLDRHLALTGPAR
jgi:hypothetical protein